MKSIKRKEMTTKEPDIERLERWLKPDRGESVSQALTRKYGERANKVIMRLLEQ